MKTSLKQILFIAISIPLLAGCIVVRERPAASGEVIVESPPPMPPPRAEVVPVAPGPPNVWVWVPGCWEWRGHYVWVTGRWTARPHPGAVWVAGHWDRHGRRATWMPGHWQ